MHIHSENVCVCVLNSTHSCTCKHAAVSCSALHDNGNRKETKDELKRWSVLERERI